jgi:exonuclease VII small subunit
MYHSIDTIDRSVVDFKLGRFVHNCVAIVLLWTQYCITIVEGVLQMPRRRNLSPDELSQIVQLRDSRTSWLKIQRRTGVPRQIAKREYVVWQQSQSNEELKQARIRVATDLFNEHLRQIVGLAEGLVNDLPQSMTPLETRDAEAVISDILARWIFGETEERVCLIPDRQETQRAQRRSSRRNQMLFRSLRDHTREKVDWRILEEWKAGWSRSREATEALRSKAEKMVQSILDNERRSIRDKIDASRGGKSILAKMVAGVIEVIWRGANDNALGKVEQFVQTRRITEGRGLIIFGELGSVTRIELADSRLANDAAEVCRQAARNLSIIDIDKPIRLYQDGTETMKQAIHKLEDALDPLVLRPMILRTRCDLCPA